LKDNLDAIEKWATAYNPFFEGAWSDLLALVPFAAISVLLYLVGRDVFFAQRKGKRL